MLLGGVVRLAELGQGDQENGGAHHREQGHHTQLREPRLQAAALPDARQRGSSNDRQVSLKIRFLDAFTQLTLYTQATTTTVTY